MRLIRGPYSPARPFASAQKNTLNRIDPEGEILPLREPVVGTYSNIRYTQEHAYGYLVDLWRQGDRIVGIFSFTDGAQADFDTGTLDNVTYDPPTGALAFESYAGMFQFSGTLMEKAVSGRLLRAPRIGVPGPSRRR